MLQGYIGYWACQYTPSRIARKMDKRARTGCWLVYNMSVTVMGVYFRVHTLLSIAISRLQLFGWTRILMFEDSNKEASQYTSRY